MVLVGDLPCCTLGCPLTLGWEYTEQTLEAMKDEQSASSHELHLDYKERRAILSDKVSDAELRKAQRRSYRDQPNSCQSNRRLARQKDAFLHPCDERANNLLPSCK